jgi:Chromate transporter
MKHHHTIVQGTFNDSGINMPSTDCNEEAKEEVLVSKADVQDAVGEGLEATPSTEDLELLSVDVEDLEVAQGDAHDRAQEETDEGTSTKSKQIRMTVAADAPWTARIWEVFVTFWPLGLVAFGGPQAHIAILREHLVIQRDWLDEESFQELFAIGQVRETELNAQRRTER